jgi:hypothetical protein
MHVYRAYWSDDPRFDSAQCIAAVPDLPSPELDDETIRRLCRFAIANRFRWPPPERAVRKVTARGLLEARLGSASWGAPGPGDSVGLSAAGGGGGQWTVLCEAGRPRSLHVGLPPTGSPSIETSSQTLESLLRGTVAVSVAVERGAVSVAGPDETSRRFAVGVLESLASAPGSAARGRESAGDFVAALR